MVTALEQYDALIGHCDRCGARAAVTIELDHGDLELCQHHATKYGLTDDPVAY